MKTLNFNNSNSSRPFFKNSKEDADRTPKNTKFNIYNNEDLKF